MAVLLYGAMTVMPLVMRMNMMALLGGMLGVTGVVGFIADLMIHAMMRGACQWRPALRGMLHSLVSAITIGAVPIIHPLIRANHMPLLGVRLRPRFDECCRVRVATSRLRNRRCRDVLVEMDGHPPTVRRGLSISTDLPRSIRMTLVVPAQHRRRPSSRHSRSAARDLSSGVP